MKLHRTTLFLLSLTAAIMLSLSACHSNNTASQAPQSPDTAQPAQAAQPAPQGDTTGAGPAPQTSAAVTPPPPAVIQLPAETSIRVRLDQDLGSKISNPGDTFQATVADDVMVHGQPVIEHGARADGTVVDAKPLGKFKGGALLSVKLDRVHTRWGTYPVETGSIEKAEQGKGKRSGVMIGGGAGLGALIGGLAGGGKGAAIGALAGGGAGTAGSAFTGNKQIVLPAETLLTFKLERPVRITEHRQGSNE